MADGRATVTVTQDGFKSMQDARGTVTGKFEIVPEEERAAVRDAYMKVLPRVPATQFWSHQHKDSTLCLVQP